MKKLGSRILHDRWVTVEETEFEFDDGRKQKYDIVRLGTGIGVLAVLNEDYDLLLTKQYRPALEQEFIELIKGKCEPDESTEQAAHRELLEETGHTGKLHYLCNLKPLPSTIDAKIDLYVATDLEKVQEQTLDEFEQLDLVVMPFMQLYKGILEGKHTDASLQLAVYRMILNHPNLS